MKPLLVALITFSMLALAACTRVSDPYRQEGVNVTVVPVRDPDRPDVDPEEWVFRLTLPGDGAGEDSHRDVASPLELIEFAGSQPQDVRDNGIWVLVNDEKEPGEALRKMLREMVQLSGREGLPLFICRSSEFPHGWDRVN